MGKGDRKTKRGKIIKGSYGVRRPKKHRNVIPEAAKKTSRTKPTPKASVEETKVKKPAVKAKKAEEPLVDLAENNAAEAVIKEKATTKGAKEATEKPKASAKKTAKAKDPDEQKGKEENPKKEEA